MKKIISVLVIVLSGCAGQSYQYATNESVNPSKVFDASGSNKDKIYSSAKMWIAENFRSAKSVIEYDNQAEGTIIGNGTIKYPCEGFECVGKGEWTVDFTMKIEVKDGRFKTSFSNLVLDLPATTGMYASASSKVPVSSQEDAAKITPKLLSFGDSITQYINKGTGSSNW